jgi:hypothetical protein
MERKAKQRDHGATNPILILINSIRRLFEERGEGGRKKGRKGNGSVQSPYLSISYREKTRSILGV